MGAGVALPSATVTYTPTNPTGPLANAEDSFDYTVTDDCGEVSVPATVAINPPDDFLHDPPDDPTEEVLANDQVCLSVPVLDEEGIQVEDEFGNPVFTDVCDLETIEGTAIPILLTGAAPCQGGIPTDEDDDAGTPNTDIETCDGLGNDVPLFFFSPTFTSLTTSAGGTVDNLVQGTGVPQRSATVLYTPLAGFTGVDSFTFEVEGDVDDSGGIDPSAEPNPEVDTGTVEISVQTFTPLPALQPRTEQVTTTKNTPVDISLSGSEVCDPEEDPDCIPGSHLPETLAGSSGGLNYLTDAQLTDAQLSIDTNAALTIDTNAALASDWRYFEWPVGSIPIFAEADTLGGSNPDDGDLTFDFTLTTAGCVSITDILLKGDQFNVYDDTILIGTTPNVFGGELETPRFPFPGSAVGTQANPDLV